MPTAYAAQENISQGVNKGRVFGTNLANANATTQIMANKEGPLTRAQARAMKDKTVAPKPQQAAVVTQPQPAFEVFEAFEEAEALAEEVGAITLDPPALPDELENPQEVGVYINDIMRYFSKNESKYMPSASFLKQVQQGIDASARATLVDWVVNVHRKFKLLKPVLPLAVNIMDRYLSTCPLTKDKLQLLGAAALLIASKFEEIYPPEIEDFVHISDRAFRKDAVIRMEGEVLNALKFNISIPTSFVFLSRFVKVAEADEETEELVEMILDATLLEYNMLKYLPSVIVTSAIVLAQDMLSTGTWNAHMQAHTGYTKAALTPCIKDVVNVLQNGYHHRLTSLVKKYGAEKVEMLADVEEPALR